MKRQVCEFDITDMLPIGITLVVAGIGIAYGMDVLGDVSDDVVKAQTLTATCNSTLNGGGMNYTVTTGCGAQFNATQDAIGGVGKIPDKMPMIATVIIAAIIIGILVRYLMVRFG